MRALMGVIKNKYGVYHARRKVPKELEEATAKVLGHLKPRVAWLKRSLGTKDLREANIRAKPVLIDFDRTLARARALICEQPVRAALNQVEIDRISEHYLASLLAADEEQRREGKELLRRYERQLKKDGVPFTPMFPLDTLPEYGLSEEQMRVRAVHFADERATMESALARGDIGAVVDEVELLLDQFGINLDRKSAAYRQLGMAVLRKHVSALQAIARRDAASPWRHHGSQRSRTRPSPKIVACVLLLRAGRR
jgi:hypothetical protein